jgi:hypothetical protein
MKNKIGILILCLFCQFCLDKLNLEKIQRSGKKRFGTGRKRNCFDANSKQVQLLMNMVLQFWLK